MGLTSFLVSIATAFVPNPLLTWASFLQPPSFWVLSEHCSLYNLSKTYLRVFHSPIQKTFNGFLLENPTFQILYKFVIAPAHALISSIYLTHCPTGSKYSLFSKHILHFPASMPSPLSCSLPIMLFLHLCLWKLHPFLKTQLRCLVLHETFYDHLKGVPFPPCTPTHFTRVTLVSSIIPCLILQELVWTPLLFFHTVTSSCKVTSYSQKVVKRALTWESGDLNCSPCSTAHEPCDLGSLNSL